MSKVWFITGTSTGFGRELAELLASRGERVVATARKPEVLAEFAAKYPDTVKAVRLDVTKPAEVHAAVSEALAAFGRIDVLVNNAGYGMVGAVEETSDSEVRRQFDTNFFGMLDVTKAILPTLRKQKSGHILNVSSVVGVIAFPAAGIYSASKFAMEAISEALAGELAPHGIKVTIVEPGAFRTAFNAGGLQVAQNRLPDYAAATDGFVGWLASMDGKQPGDPRQAAEAMLQVVESETPPLRLVLGQDAVGGVEMKLKSVQTDLDAWREVSMNVHYSDATYGTIGG